MGKTDKRHTGRVRLRRARSGIQFADIYSGFSAAGGLRVFRNDVIDVLLASS